MKRSEAERLAKMMSNCYGYGIDMKWNDWSAKGKKTWRDTARLVLSHYQPKPNRKVRNAKSK